MTRLVIDARLTGHSGIGTYLEHVLPRVVARLGSRRPAVLARTDALAGLAARLGKDAEVVEWEVPPLGARNLASAPPALGPHDLLWTPHFNVPLIGSSPLAVTLHDLLPLTAPELAGRGRSVPVRLWMRAVRARARVVFCVSEFTRREAIERAGLDPARLVVTPLAVGTHWLARPAETSDPAKIETRSPPTIVFVGLMKPHKNIARLLQAFDRVKEAIPHRLVLVARRAGLARIDREVLPQVRALGERVELVEDLPVADLVARVRSAQFAVLPSLSEGFGLPALEAMAVGTPVLAARAGALPEVCGDAAAYCDPMTVEDIARGLLSLASDPMLRSRLASAGIARAAAFSWDRCASVTADALDAELRSLGAGRKR